MRISKIIFSLLLIVFLSACSGSKKMSTIALRAHEEPCSIKLYQNNEIKYKFTTLGRHIVEPGDYYVVMMCQDVPYQFIAHCYPNEIAEINANASTPLKNARHYSPSGQIISLNRE